MNVKKFFTPREHEKRRETSLFLLQNFDESCLKVTRHRSGEHEDSNDYQIQYQKFGEKTTLPLYFVISQFYGCVSNNKLDVFSKKYLNVRCGAVFNEFKKVVEIIIEKISEIRGKKYEINSDYLKIRVGECDKSATDLPVDDLIKISWAVVSFRLIIESEKGLFVLNNLKECFHELSINDDFEIIESKK